MKRWDPMSRDVLEAHIVGEATKVFRDELKALDLKGPATARPFISISREFGCEGTDVALKLAETLNGRGKYTEADKWICYDRALLEKLAEDHDLRTEVVQSAQRHDRSIFEQYLHKELAKRPDDYDVFQFLAGAITTLAKRGNVILVGRGSPVITQVFTQGFFVRIYGSAAFKVKRVRERMPDLAGDEDAISSFIEREGKKRDKFVEQFTMHNPADPRFYHLILNNAKFTIPEMTDLIIAGLKVKGYGV